MLISTLVGMYQAVLWNMDTLKLKSSLEEHSLLITDVRFSPNSTRLATSSFDKTVRVWDADNVSHNDTFSRSMLYSCLVTLRTWFRLLFKTLGSVFVIVFVKHVRYVFLHWYWLLMSPCMQIVGLASLIFLCFLCILAAKLLLADVYWSSNICYVPRLPSSQRGPSLLLRRWQRDSVLECKSRTVYTSI